jgi:vacuolar-type H+-ATPase subunit E/Vma4
MNLDAFRRTILADAHKEARRRVGDAEEAAQRQVSDAQAAGARLLEEARAEGCEAAELEAARRRAEARRTAHQRVLRARRDALERLRRRVLDGLDEHRDDEAYDRLLDCLEAAARRQLGPGTDVDRAPAGGGLVAKQGGRRVDYRLPVLVDDELSAMGARLRELWS